MIHHYREKLLNYQKKINTFFSEYPFISLERIILLIVALFLHVRLNNRFTTCFAIVAFLVLFLQQILVGLSFLLDLFSLIYAWGKNNYEDIKHLLSYLFFELAAFILIFVTSLIIGRAVLNLLNINISICFFCRTFIDICTYRLIFFFYSRVFHTKDILYSEF